MSSTHTAGRIDVVPSLSHQIWCWTCRHSQGYFAEKIFVMFKAIARWLTRPGSHRRTRRRLPLAYKTRRGHRVWLYMTFDEVATPVNGSWEQMREFPSWVEAVLSERPEEYQSPGRDEGFALLFNGKHYQYLYWTYRDWGAYGHGNAAHYEDYYRRRK